MKENKYLPVVLICQKMIYCGQTLTKKNTDGEVITQDEAVFGLTFTPR